jgi:hypothetical protein
VFRIRQVARQLQEVLHWWLRVHLAAEMARVSSDTRIVCLDMLVLLVKGIPKSADVDWDGSPSTASKCARMRSLQISIEEVVREQTIRIGKNMWEHLV